MLIKIKEEIKDNDLLLIFSNFDFNVGEFIGFSNLLLKNGSLLYSVKWPPFKDQSGNIGIKWEVPKPYEYPYDHFNVDRYGGDQDYPNLYELNSDEKEKILTFLQQKVANWGEIVQKIEPNKNNHHNVQSLPKQSPL